MGRITSSIGLATGFPIEQTVNQLLALQARPRDLLVNQNKKIDGQRTAITTLTAQLVSVQFQVRKLTQPAVYKQRTVATSDVDLLAVTANGQPEIGQYQFTPLRKAQAQQLQSSRFAAIDQPIGKGSFSFRFGGFINKGVDLGLLGNGEGLDPGKIRITDRSGAMAEIDLTTARNIDDVLEAINANRSIRVRASVVNDRIRLTDLTGQELANLRVDEVGGGATATSLGLSGINVAANVAEGADILNLFGDLALSQLNDGRGVRFDGVLGDLRITLRDGSRINLDFDKAANVGTKASATTAGTNGPDAKITFTAVKPGPEADGIEIDFVDDASITAGNEVVTYDEDAKRLTIRIDEGVTTANQVIAALGKDPEAAAVLTAVKAEGTNGNGAVSASDDVTTAGPVASAITTGKNGDSAKLLIKAKIDGPEYDNVAIRFVHDPNVTQGNETVTFNNSNPLNKELVIGIFEGRTSANDVIAAINGSAASQYFSAEKAPVSNGVGRVSTEDTGFTSGGTLREASAAVKDITLQQVIDQINAVDSTKLRASIGADNNLVLEDLTTDSGQEFKVEQLNGSHAAEDLGLDVKANAGTITGNRLLAGLKTSMLSSLNGGKGLGELGELTLTDRMGAVETLDLKRAQTLDDVIEAINTAGIGVSARVNDARNGIEVSDISRGTGNLIIANGADDKETAKKLGIEFNSAANRKSSGNMKLQVVNENTLLSTLRGGAGVGRGTIRIADNAGKTATINIDSDVKTIGDVLDEINSRGLAIEARVNDAGDGIVLIDKSKNGGETFKVEEGNGTAARDLNLLGGKKTIKIDNKDTQIIEGSTTYKIEITETDTLQNLVDKINGLNTPIRSTIFSDGSSVRPYRFTMFNQSTGEAGELLWDTSEAGFTLAETVKAQDALIQIGDPSSGGVIAASSTNEFRGLIPDVTLTVKGTSTTAVTVNVDATDTNLVTAVKDFVEGYNKLRAKLVEVTRFDETTQTSAVLQGDARVQRVENDLGRLLSGRIFGTGIFQSIEAIGISLKDNGELALDESKLKQRFAENPNDLKEFLSKKDTGLASRMDKLIEQLAGAGETVLVGRVAVLTRKIETNQQRIDTWNLRLEKSRERLTRSFQRSESIISKLQASLSAISAIAPIPILAPQQNN